MHKSSMLRMEWFVKSYVIDDTNKKILDVGSYGVNGTYKELFLSKKIQYVGLDIVEGPNVDIVMDEPYLWASIEDNSYDYIISGQAFEHIEYPWLTIREIYKKLKPGGITCIIAPNTALEHKYPYDCYRYFSDGLSALAKWVGLKVLDVSVAGIPSRGISPDWYSSHNDVCLIAMKEDKETDISMKYPKLQYERRYNGEADQALHYDFLAKWIQEESYPNNLLRFIEEQKVSKVYIYGYDHIGKIIYQFLRKAMNIPVQVIDENPFETITLESSLNKNVISRIDENSLMIISHLDYCRDLVHYLEQIYIGIPKFYVDEILESIRYRNFFKTNKEIYLYGSGKFGKKTLSALSSIGLTPNGFIVTKKDGNVNDIENLKVFELSELKNFSDIGIIISVGKSLRNEIKNILVLKGIKSYIDGVSF